MAGPSRKFLEAVRLPALNSSSTISPPGQRQLRAALQDVGNNIEINDDEKERFIRREQIQNVNSTSISSVESNRHQLSLSTVFNISAAEMNNQIAECIKLNAENKITSKNAFQLKMIDLLLYALKKQDPSMANLQLASASLDASAKIYGFRVDKVYSDLLKIIGKSFNDREHQDKNSGDKDIVLQDLNSNERQQKKKKKRNRQHIITTVEALKGNVESYNPLSLIRCQIDTQTSDKLFQAGLSQHANQGVALNLHNDVILDNLPPTNDISVKLLTYLIDDFTNQKISPSYAVFKFLDWLLESQIVEQQAEDSDVNYHFNLDAPVPVDDAVDNNESVMDCEEAYEERCDRMEQNNQNVENIVDVENIIARNPDTNVTDEYSYLPKSYHWAGPSYWKVKLNKGSTATRKRKEIELSFSIESQEERKNRYQINRLTSLLSKTKKLTWSEDKVTLPQDEHYDCRHLSTFFNKPAECVRFSDNERIDETGANNSEEQFGGNDIEEERFTQESNHIDAHETVAQTQAIFIGDNLVSVPKLTDKVFIPYSQRAKKINMYQLKKAMWKSLRTNAVETGNDNSHATQKAESENDSNEILPKKFSDVYVELPKMLSKVNANSLSPAIAFSSLLHLPNDKNLKISKKSDLSDLIIQSGNDSTVVE